MARKQGKTDESASADVWTNVSQNPVILGDGSTVAPGATTSPEQAELAEGSFWEEHGVLVSGAPVLSDDGASQIEQLAAENAEIRGALHESVQQVKALKVEIEALKAKVPAAK